jgi:phenol 2-monooxygenase (NADPH)
MQFHLNGFEAGDPEIFDQSQRHPASGAQGNIPEEVDVLIVGCGPAGLTLQHSCQHFPT